MANEFWQMVVSIFSFKKCAENIHIPLRPSSMCMSFLIFVIQIKLDTDLVYYTLDSVFFREQFPYRASDTN